MNMASRKYCSCLRLFATIGIVALLQSACTGDMPQGPDVGPIRIGALYPLSGPDANTGADLRAGLELALEFINERHELPLPLANETGLSGQMGRKIELIYHDTKSDPIRASDGLAELVSREGIVAAIGCYHSSVTALASEQAEMARIPFLNAESTSPVLIQRGLQWFFRTTPDDRTFSRNFFEFLNEMRKMQRLSLSCPLALVYEDGLWGTNVAQAQQRLAWEHEYRIAADIPYSAAAENFQAELEKVESAMPAVVLQASYARDALALVRGYSSMRLPPVAVLGMNAGFVSPEFLPTLGPDAENVLSREVWALDLAHRKPLVEMVNNYFRRRYNHDMSGNSARSFTALMVLADAINRAPGMSSEAIRKGILQTDLKADDLIMPWDGIRFDPETGQNVLGKGIIVQVQQGRYVTVWPDSLAVRPPIWPGTDCRQEK